MNERLDYLLSVQLDDELDAAEREELDGLLRNLSESHPEAHAEATDRFASFESINALVQTIGTSAANRQSGLDAGLDAVRARIDEANSAPRDALAPRRRARSAWIPSFGLAAAAALAVYFVVPQDVPFSSDPPGSTSQLVTGNPGADGPRESQIDVPTSSARGSAGDHAANHPAAVPPIALAVVFDFDEDAEDEDAESIQFIDSMSADDFEIVEQLELLEFLASRETQEGRG